MGQVPLVLSRLRLDHLADDSVLLVLVPLCWLAATLFASFA